MSSTLAPSSQSEIEHLQMLAGQYDLVAIYAFGSRAPEIAARLAGETVEPEYPRSDLDIGVLPLPDRRLQVDEKVHLAIAIEDIFDVPRVDLVVLPETPTFLALEVVRGELLYAMDSHAEAEFQLYVLRKAGDLAAWELERRRMILAGEAF
jgi:predicted nucleotidyltransferase